MSSVTPASLGLRRFRAGQNHSAIIRDAPSGQRTGRLMLRLILASYLFSQMLTWFACWWQTAGVVETPAITAARLGLQIPLLAAFGLALYSGAFRRLPQSLRWLGVLAAMTLLFSSVRGLLGAVTDDYGLRYVFGDMFRFLVSWGGLFGVIGARILLGEQSDESRRMLIKTIAVIAVIDALMTMLLYFRFNIFKISTSAYMPGLFLGLAYLSRYPFRSLVPVLLGLCAIAMSGKRYPLIVLTAVTVFTFAASVFVPMLLGRQVRFSLKRLSRLVMASVTGAALVVVIVASVEAAGAEVVTNRVTALVESVSAIVAGFTDSNAEMDGSYQSRLYERDNVEVYYAANLMDLPFGAGLGAEIPMVFDTSVQTPSGRMHHAHITWVVYLLRNGIFGFLVLAFYFTVTTAIISRNAFFSADRSAPLFIAGFMQIVCDFLQSFSGNVMLENFSILPAVAIAWSLGASANMRRKQLTGSGYNAH